MRIFQLELSANATIGHHAATDQHRVHSHLLHRHTPTSLDHQLPPRLHHSAWITHHVDQSEIGIVGQQLIHEAHVKSDYLRGYDVASPALADKRLEALGQRSATPLTITATKFLQREREISRPLLSQEATHIHRPV